MDTILYYRMSFSGSPTSVDSVGNDGLYIKTIVPIDDPAQEFRRWTQEYSQDVRRLMKENLRLRALLASNVRLWIGNDERASKARLS
jgi:hypothetical protein